MHAPFHFKQFSINQENIGMPVSTDGVLLGAWSRFPSYLSEVSSPKLLDIGTGSGLLSLMCLQRNPNFNATAVELDKASTKTAQKNFNQSLWASNINTILGDILTMKQLPTFDVIVCNPPYFNSGQTTDNKSRADARHTQTLGHNKLIDFCKKHLNENGCANFILPTNEAQGLINHATLAGLTLTESCHVKTTPNKPISRYLMCFTHNVAPQLSKSKEIITSYKSSQLTIRDHNNLYSNEFIALTKDFYLNL